MGSVVMYSHQDECGLALVAENLSSMSLNIAVDCTGSTGVVSSRGSLLTEDALPPGSRCLILALSPKEGAERYGWSLQQSFQLQPGGLEMHIPPLESAVDAIHQAVPLRGGAAFGGVSFTSGSGNTSIRGGGQDPMALEEEMLQAAIQASMGHQSGTQPPAARL